MVSKETIQLLFMLFALSNVIFVDFFQIIWINYFKGYICSLYRVSQAAMDCDRDLDSTNQLWSWRTTPGYGPALNEALHMQQDADIK